MPSSKSGTPGSPVAPADPVEPKDADDADPGTVEKAKTFDQANQTGKYGSTPVKPLQKDDDPTDDPTKTTWIEILLVDDDNNPVPGEAYKVTFSDQTVSDGTLDDKGFIRIDGVPPGACQISFPYLDQDVWSPA